MGQRAPPETGQLSRQWWDCPPPERPAKQDCHDHVSGPRVVRPLIAAVDWGQQPGISDNDQLPHQESYRLLNAFGIPINTDRWATETNSAMVALLSPDLAVRRRSNGICVAL